MAQDNHRHPEKTVYYETKKHRPSATESIDSETTLQPVEQTLDAEANIDKSTDVVASAKNYEEPSPPPNGGFTAWLQVAGAWFLWVNCWGLINTFGVFQTYYEDNPLWYRSPSDISWIGSIQAFLLLLVGVVSGPMYDAGYFRHLIIAGTFFVVFGFMMTSLCQTYWQTVLAQGVLIGLGNGCLFVPSVAIIPQWFSTRKAFANGIAATGSSIGGIIYPIAFRNLLLKIGFGWATRVLGFIALAGLCFSICVMKLRIKPQGKRKLTQLSAFTELPYVLFTFSTFFAFMGFYGPIYYIQTFAIETGISSVSFAFYLLPILNAGSVPGRIFPNLITDYIGPLNVLGPAAALSGILSLCWIGIHNLSGTIAFAVLYGFFSGAFVSLPPVALTSLTKDMRYLGTRMGQTFFTSSFGLLIGSPVSGAIYARTHSFLGLQLFSGIAMFITGALLIATRISVVGTKLKIKV